MFCFLFCLQIYKPTSSSIPNRSRPSMMDSQCRVEGDCLGEQLLEVSVNNAETCRRNISLYLSIKLMILFES